MSAESADLEMLKAEISAQGTIVRGLKESGASKEDVAAAVAKLLELKKKFTAAGGVDEPKKETGKKEAAPASASGGAAEREAAKEARRREREAKTAAATSRTADAPTDLMAALVASSPFGRYQLVRSEPTALTGRVFTDIRNLDKAEVGSIVHVRGYLQNSMPTNKKRVFLHLREAIYTVQAVVQTDTDGVTVEMVKFVTALLKESIVDIEAVVAAPPDEITGCTVSTRELVVRRLYVVNACLGELPFQLADASQTNTGDDDQTTTSEATAAAAAAAAAEGRVYSHVGQEIRLNNRWIDVRTRANQGIFRLQSVSVQAFRNFLLGEGFVEIHTPKMVATASEGGAGVFKVNYFDTHVYLAQSPQLYKQMAICSGLQRVFEVGPVFRAENSNTNRHLTEFTGLDMEMEFKEDYREVLDVIGRMFVAIFDELGRDTHAELRNAVASQHPFEPLQYPRETLVLTFPEAMQLLADNGHEFTDPLGRLADLDTPTEKKLGRLVKAKYGTDFYILNYFPTHIRPFYTMPSPITPPGGEPGEGVYSNSYDVFLRGQEIVSGAQRIHDPELLLRRAAELKVDLTPIQAYVDSFRHGAPPHAGCGCGMERLIMLYLGLTNIRKTTFFPRDPVRVTP